MITSEQQCKCLCGYVNYDLVQSNFSSDVNFKSIYGVLKTDYIKKIMGENDTMA